jgi:hypothetical protein
MPRVTSVLVGVLAAVSLLCSPASGASAHRVWCDMFRVSYAVNTTCAVEGQVSRLYAAGCIPKNYRGCPSRRGTSVTTVPG